MKWLHNILKGASLTTALFIFQACYGSPIDYDGISMDFKLVSSVDGDPIPGVNVSFFDEGGYVPGWRQVGTTDADGFLWYRFENTDSVKLRFSTEDGSYVAKDTVFTVFHTDIYEVRLDKAE